MKQLPLFQPDDEPVPDEWRFGFWHRMLNGRASPGTLQVGALVVFRPDRAYGYGIVRRIEDWNVAVDWIAPVGRDPFSETVYSTDLFVLRSKR